MNRPALFSATAFAVAFTWGFTPHLAYARPEIKQTGCTNRTFLKSNLSKLRRSLEPSKGRTRSLVWSKLSEAAEAQFRANPRHASQIEIEGIRIPKLRPDSKWRAIVVTPESDTVDQVGYLSGFERNGDRVPEWQSSKYRAASGNVQYRFADGRTALVTAQEARALEFSYLDTFNPKSPKNTTVVGIHEDPAKIVPLVRQASAELLRDPRAYIRLDEISPDGLKLTSAEKLYERFGLSHPRYSPKGEWASDGSIPRENIVASFKFRAVSDTQEIPKSYGLKKGQEVYYKALSGKTFMGLIDEERSIDGNVIVSYVNRHGEKQYDMAPIASLTRSGPIPGPGHRFRFDAKAARKTLEAKTVDFEGFLRILSEDPELNKMYLSDTGTAEGYSGFEHASRVFRTFREFRSAHRNLPKIRTPGGDPAEKFLTKLIAIHDLGKPRAMAHKGIRQQHEYTRPVAKAILEQLGTKKEDIELAEAIIGDDLFGRVFNQRLVDRLTPAALVTELRKQASKLGMRVDQLYDLHLAFYLADAGSYPVVRTHFFAVAGDKRLVPKSPDFIELERMIARYRPSSRR